MVGKNDKNGANDNLGAKFLSRLKDMLRMEWACRFRWNFCSATKRYRDNATLNVLLINFYWLITFTTKYLCEKTHKIVAHFQQSCIDLWMKSTRREHSTFNVWITVRCFHEMIVFIWPYFNLLNFLLQRLSGYLLERQSRF